MEIACESTAAPNVLGTQPHPRSYGGTIGVARESTAGRKAARLAAASDRFDFDSDINAGALTVEFEDPRERFVVSPNAPVRQIWVSANVKS